METNITETVTRAIRLHSDGVFRLALRITGNRDDALDISQEAFAKTLRGSSDIRDMSKLKAYLFRTAYNLALNHKRDRSRRRAHDTDIIAQTSNARAPGPDEVLDEQRISEGLEKAIYRLADRQREAVTLRFYGDLTLVEIAAAMGISEASVRVHLARGLQGLKQALTGHKEQL